MTQEMLNMTSMTLHPYRLSSTGESSEHHHSTPPSTFEAQIYDEAKIKWSLLSAVAHASMLVSNTSICRWTIVTFMPVMPRLLAAQSHAW